MKPISLRIIALIFFACLIGFAIAKIDTSKNWDDTAITVGLILMSCFILAVMKPNLAWLFALVIGGFVFCFNVLQAGNYGSAASILFAFIGAYAGFVFKKFIVGSHTA